MLRCKRLVTQHAVHQFEDLQQLTPKCGMLIDSSLHAKPNNLACVFASRASGLPGRDKCEQIVRLHHAVWPVVGGSFMCTFCRWWRIDSIPRQA